MTEKQHAEAMDALHTIGRNIAQQDATRLAVAHAIGSLSSTLNSLGLIAVILWIISMCVVVPQ